MLNLFLHQTRYFSVIVAKNTENLINLFSSEIRGERPTETRSILVQETKICPRLQWPKPQWPKPTIEIWILDRIESNFGPNWVKFWTKSSQILDKSSQILIQNLNFVSLFSSEIWPKNTKISEFCPSRTGPVKFGLIWSNMFKLCLMYV
jgi:hypothetical protein